MFGIEYRESIGSATVAYPFGIFGIAVDPVDPGYLLGATGSGGGVLTFSIGAGGALGYIGATDFNQPLQAGVRPDLTIAGEGAVLVVSGMAEVLRLDPATGSVLGWADTVPEAAPTLSAVNLGGGDLLSADTSGGVTWYAVGPGGAFSVLGATGGAPAGPMTQAAPGLVLALDIARDALDLVHLGPGGGVTIEAGPSAADGIGWEVPHLVEALTIAGKTYAVVGAAGSSSLTVLAIEEDAPPLPVDHVVDDLATRFRNVTALAVHQADGRTLLAAAGSDDGLTLFELLPNGRLVGLEVLEETGNGALRDIAALALFRTGATLSIVTGTESSAGLHRHAMDLGALGAVLMGSDGDDTLTGTVRADVLYDGDGSDTITGGAGADIFVMAADGRLDRVMDFELGVDRLDLSAFEGLYSLGALSVTPTTSGARLRYGTEVIEVTTADRQSFDRDDLRLEDILTVTRPPFAPIGRELEGGALADLLDGGLGPDRLDGGAGDDLLAGGASGDLLIGGPGDDRLDGETGDDVIYGGDGADTLIGGTGDDTLRGGAGSDSLQGGEGNDTLMGGAEDDHLAGGSGADILRGGAGDDHLMGGSGQDRLVGGAGADLMWGGADADVFVFAPGDGTDRIADFETGDILDLTLLALNESWVDFQARISEVEGGTEIDLGPEAVLFLEGLAADLLTSDAFLF